MRPRTRLAVYAATVAAVMVLGIDWEDQDGTGRRHAMPHHPAARNRLTAPGCACTPCKVLSRTHLSDEEVFRRFAGIVFADRRRMTREDS